MNDAEFQLLARGDPRLAPYAASHLPAWLWTSDGTRILWANPAGVSAFGATSVAVLAGKTFGPADRHRRQVARLAGGLRPNGAIRLERLQGFGAAPGGLATCGCSRFDFPDGSHGVLIVAGNVSLVAPRATQAAPAPAFDPAQPEEAVPEPPRAAAEEPPIAAVPPAPDYQRIEQSGEAPAEFALFDALSDASTDDLPADGVPANDERADDLANEPAEPAAAEAPAAVETPPSAPSPAVARASLPHARRLPLRFTWQMDRDGCFTLGANEFTGLMGPRTTESFGRPWSEIAEKFTLDPDRRVMKAFATGATWNGITLNWPVDGGGRLPVELSGLPIFDRDRNFIGYRGFGVCRDFDALARLAAMRLAELSDEADHADTAKPLPAELNETISIDTSNQDNLEMPVDTPKDSLTEWTADTANVLPFRPAGEIKAPSLTPGENSAFDELARRLAARLEPIDETIPDAPSETTLEQVTAPVAREVFNEQPEWLTTHEPPARGEAGRDRALLDLLPIGILIYRLDRLLYANPAFLTQMGYPSLHALEEAGGLDALYVEAGVSNASSTSDTGTPVTISANPPDDADAPPSAADARLYTISWDGDSALALIFSGARHESAAIAAAISQPAPAQEPDVSEPSAVGHVNAEELAAILDTTADGIVMFDAEGKIIAANRSAEALFGLDGDELARRNMAELFAPESRHDVFEYLAAVRAAGVASLLDHGREVLGRESKGGIIPLSMTMGRTRPDGPNFFAVFRDLSQARKTENELREARRLAERAANAKADVLARISHEVRTPLNAIIGFSEVMIAERFGALGNERYLEYMKDIRASGERVIAVLNDLLDLSRIETGKLDLAFTSQNLNELVESCVTVMQPQANRERIIIRTSLAHTLPPVTADARALRQITLNLIGTSIHLANAGGQVIVSTALSDFGEVSLRVRDTGHGLNDNEVAAAMEPFRTTPSDKASEASAVSLSLTKALVEANRAKFQIKTGGRSGTLIEVVFPHAVARA